jgi:hypothetical protein
MASHDANASPLPVLPPCATEVGKVLTGNGITRYGERDALLQLCRQRLDGFREQRGEELVQTL